MDNAGKRYFAYVVLLALAGCASGPGLNMDESHFRVQQPDAGKISSADASYTITPITASLVRQQNAVASRRDEASANFALDHQLTQYHYHIGPQDILNIIVFNHPDLTTPAGTYRSAEESGYVVTRAGTITFPFAGTLKVAGLTASQVQEELSRRLAVYLRNPQVNVRVANYRSQKINVVGEVKKPGILPITDVPMTAVEAINRAEGPTPEADLQNVVITRGNRAFTVDMQSINDRGNTAQNLLLRDGDLVNVMDRSQNKIYILGEVTKSAAYQMHKGKMSLAEALGLAQGFSQAADARRIYVIRGNLSRPTIYRLDGNAPDAMLLATQFQLQPSDVVYVSTAEVSRFGRLLSNIIPSLTALPALKP